MAKHIRDLPQADFSYNDLLSGRFSTLQAAMALEHGPIFRWSLQGGRRDGEYVHMVGPEANRFVLHVGREHFSHDRGWTPVIGDWMGKGLLNMDPPEHTYHRKLWSPAFTAAVMELYLPAIRQIVNARVHTWFERGELDVLEEARRITFDIAASTLAGFAPGPQLDEVRQHFYAPDEATRARCDELLLELIAERRSRPLDQHVDVVGLVVHGKDADGAPLSDAEILAHIKILLIAGHETTTILCAWTLHLLAMLPEQQERIVAELVSLLGDSTSPLSIAALRQMKQLDHLLKEVGRLYSPVVNLPRGVVRDVVFGGYLIPAGTQVRLAIGAGHLLPHIFADPHQFDPERFAPPREEDRRTPYGLVTFGAGPRVCIGVNFAAIEVKYVIAHVLRTYRLEGIAGQPIVHAGGILAGPSAPIRLQVHPRSATAASSSTTTPQIKLNR